MALNAYSLKFDGNKVVILDTTKTMTVRNLTAFTLAAWVKINAASVNTKQRAYVERQGTGSKIRLAMTPMRDIIRFEFGPKDGTDDVNYDFRSPTPGPTGVGFATDLWTHLAFTVSISSNNYHIIVNGQDVATGELTLPADLTAVSNTAMLGTGVYVGNHLLSGSTYAATSGWRGSLDEVLLFDTALSASTIQTYIEDRAHWTIEENDNILNYWKLDNGTYATASTTTTDAKNSKTGTLYYLSGGSPVLVNGANNPWQFDRPFLGDGLDDLVAPTAPTLVSGGVVMTADTAAVTWTGVRDGATSLDVAASSIGYVQNFQAQVATTNNFSVLVNTVSTQANTLTFTNLVGNTTHYFRVRALDAAGNSGTWSATVSKPTLADADLTPPVVPAGLIASLITHNSFTMSWGAVGGGDLAGYYIDIARDPSFTSYLFNYQGASTASPTVAVLGATALTAYYVRVYSYDTSGNVSNPSDVYVVQTSTPPDTSPPTNVLVDQVTSIGAVAATLNWDASRDDTFVSHYLIDVSTDNTFPTVWLPELDIISQVAINAGNVTSYRVTGLRANTVFYYRIRAVDSIGNTSNNPNTPYTFTTAVSTVDDIGVYETQVETGNDAEVNSAATTTNYGLLTTLSVVGTTVESFLEFDLQGFSGDFVSATLNIFATDASTDSHWIVVDNQSFDEETITWATKPTLVGTPQSFTPLTAGWNSVDITDFLIDGPTLYTARIYKTAGTDTLTFRSKNDDVNTTEHPFINIEVNPSSATQPDQLSVDVERQGVVNTATNPEFLVNTTGWTAAWTAGTVTLTRVADAASWYGGFAGAFSASGAHTDASLYQTARVPAVVGDVVSISCAIKKVSGSNSFRFRVQEWLEPANTLQSTQGPFTIDFPGTSSEWFVFEYAVVVTSANTTHIAPAFLPLTDGVASAFNITGYTVTVNAGPNVAPFTGNSNGAEWTGTAGISTSKTADVSLTAVGSYLGDSNDNNTSLMEITSFAGQYTTSPSQRKIDLLNRFHEHQMSALWVGNYLQNPSFESGTSGWITSGTGITLAAQQTNPVNGNWSALVTISAGASSPLIRSRPNIVRPGEVVWAGASFMAPAGKTVRCHLVFYTNSGGGGTTTPYVVGVSEIIGTGVYQTINVSPLVVPATSAYTRVIFSSLGGEVFAYSLDSVILARGNVIGPYIDGDFGGRWLGIPHVSPTAVAVIPEETYSIKQVYTDADGVYDNQGVDNTSIDVEYTVLPSPNNSITLGVLSFTPTETTLSVTTPFTGDDNANATAYYVYRRADKTLWTRASTNINRVEETISATIENLTPGTRYVTRLYVADADDVFGMVEDSGEYYIETELTITSLSGTSLLSDITIMYGGFVLAGADQEGIGVISHDAFGLPERRLQLDALARQHGSLLISDLWGPKTITMSGYVEGSSREVLQGNIMAITGALARQGLQTLIVDTLSPRRLFYSAICESFSMPENANETFTKFDWDATFICPDPFAYEQRTTTSQLQVTNASPDITLFNNGNIITPLYFEVTTTFSRPVYVTITNLTSGELIRPYSPVSAGDVMIIDTDKRLIIKNGTELSYAGGFINLVPGNNVLSVSLTSVAATPTVDYSASWNVRYV